MEDYADEAGRLLADRYRLPRPPAASHQLTESVAYDTASGQEVLVRQVPLPEVVEAEVLGGEAGAGGPDGAAGEGFGAAGPGGTFRGSVGRATRRPADPAVRRALEAAVASARLPDHARLDQVFDVFVEGDGLWIVSELLPATPLESLLTHQTLSAHRAAEIAADVLTALRVVHAHGWTHRNVTARTVLICDDGRALLTGLAVGAAQEALCGYNPLPDSGREALPPSGNIPDEALPGGGAGEPGRSGPGGRGEGAGDVPLPGIALPDGFDVRQDDAPYGGGPAGEAPGSGTDGGPRGIFGLQGFGPGDDAAEQSGPPVRHGYETGSHGGRGAAAAAYQAGARRGAAARAHGAEPGERGPEPEGRRHPEHVREEGTGPREDWWNRPEPSLPAAGPHSTPDDYVRWFPSGEDEVTPSDLPGSRPPNSLPVKATWRPAVSQRVEDPEPAGQAGSTGDDPYDYDYDGEGDAFADEGDPDSRPWGGEGAEESGGAEGFNGPATALAAERARQARMTVVGAVSERWAPEQAGPVHQNWRLAPPVGPSADLWALGVLLFRAVQGHAPYPEDDVAELVQMVCGEPPAFAEECGALRPVVESLLRQDPTERPDFEELRGWLRSLVRSAPEPDAGWHTVYAPSLDPGGTTNPRRLPILRRRGELVRRRKAARRAARAEARQQQRQQKERQKRPPAAPPQQPPAPYAEPVRDQRYEHRQQAPPYETAQYEAAQYQPAPAPPQPEQAPAWEQAYAPAQAQAQEPRPKRERSAAHRPPKPVRDKRRAPSRSRTQGQGASPRKLGGMLLGVVLAGLVAALVYAVMFMPGGDPEGSGNQQRGSVGGESRPPEQDDGSGGDTGGTGGEGEASGGDEAENPRPSGSAGKAPKGYKLSRDPAGFQVAVPEAWNRRSTTGRGQVRYNGGAVEMVLVNGRDSVRKYGRDPMAYQSDDEPELSAYRASDWASTSGLRRIDVGDTAMAEGTFSWKDGGRDVYARNRAMIVGGRYHVLMVMGSKTQKAEIDRHFEAVADTYRPTGR